ncbi:serine/threonine-protein phosphatase 6 regulatory ankyrin repeat subunit A-like isoform X2 [Mercenaria mercenaria]|uniref:serine/threonine-protein phosphatase 6 regulatory ankyrin repeat subunit A-like isoform X2 n=1 Tax=Mercenaria mercenaria TaxID=6596 RepID=UPI00234E717E|nr:serine/threonine-protein phosphatase 6 regulatory ankyrin repeat subunit A-like isoform X2 [Mercenaria mercenaria]XP_053375017.1 serine/threonine-protein phosphatase 6 regulatory ankyrin repeat subunit A-like isoform X2 [Mercenaria mercenaria]XP_053375018.1 serine/threonine-protein phosphatase 6 regulatory ankyrin repeat subunit A-like isoform X2 [Mercenaria mercenaria]
MPGKFLDRIGLLKARKKTKKASESSGHADEEQKFINQEEEFSRSVDVSAQRNRSVSADSDTSSFVQSVIVVPSSSSDGKYTVYTGVHDNIPASRLAVESESKRASFLSSLQYGHNISNPELRQHRFENDNSDWAMRKLSLTSRLKRNSSSAGSRLSSSDNLSGNFRNDKCQCGQYHSHVFKSQRNRLSKITVPKLEEHLPGKKTADMSQGNENQEVISDIFWKASLSFTEYKHGCNLVEFKSLWPPTSTIRSLLQEGIEDIGLRGALWELCLLVMVDGPVSVLQALLEMKYIRQEYQYENDPGLLHVACVLQNLEAVQLLTQFGVSSKVKDKSGKTAEEVCLCPKIRKQLNTKLQASFRADRNKVQTALKPGLQDKDVIFRLASNPKCLYELQKKLQTFDFHVNGETKGGDYLVHVIAKSGICQLPLLMSLVRLQQADVNLCNADGMTPLMIVALDGDSNFCDTLMCLMGADPNKQNEKNGRTAIHYAVMNNHVNVVNCLVKRGADVNLEDKDRCRPDDAVLPGNEAGDCRQIIQLHRVQRCQQLSEMVRDAYKLEVDTCAWYMAVENKDAVYPIDLRLTDLSVVDSDYNTLIMVAAVNAKVHNLETLLGVCTDTINAQHSQTGLTALSMAAKAGHDACCNILLSHGACASIQDMQGYLAIHHAVLQNHENVVDVFREHTPSASVGLYKSLRLCRKSSIHEKLTEMFEKRQDQIIIPQLRLSAMDGNAEKLFCILEEGDNVNSKSDLSSQPVLFVAVENSHVEVVKLLVEKGADLKKRDARTGNTVLHVSSQTGHLETANYLLPFCKKSQNQSSSKNRLDINAVNNDKRTALQIAAEKGYIKLTSLLIECGATTAILDPKGTLFTSPEFEGARVLIEGHRNEHTQAVMKLVADKSKKAPFFLSKIWVSRFDHNLRDKNGDTPLMVACRFGRLETVKFLLQSAVYANQISDDDSDHSDTDSGVPDLPPWKSHVESVNHEELMKTLEKSGDHDNLPLGATCDLARPLSLNPSDMVNTLPGPVVTERGQNKVTSYLTDVERPKGLYIYHDGIVSHICAVNLFDGNTPLHRTIEGGDYSVIATNLVEADGAVINMQNDAGLTPVHLACKLGRKKILEKLLTVNGIDLNLLTLNGHLPEEITNNKTLIKMVQKARKGQPVRQRQVPVEGQAGSVRTLTESLPSVKSFGGGSTINFDKINDIYHSLRQPPRAGEYIA